MAILRVVIAGRGGDVRVGAGAGVAMGTSVGAAAGATIGPGVGFATGAAVGLGVGVAAAPHASTRKVKTAISPTATWIPLSHFL
jgi:hypothetical protein